jgi:hypothetical protein
MAYWPSKNGPPILEQSWGEDLGSSLSSTLDNTVGKYMRSSGSMCLLFAWYTIEKISNDPRT